MDEILTWLRTQPGGMGTYVALHERLLAAVQNDPQNAAAGAILAGRVNRFIDAYEREILPSALNTAVLESLTGCLDRLIASRDADAAQKLDLLNEIARERLDALYS